MEIGIWYADWTPEPKRMTVLSWQYRGKPEGEHHSRTLIGGRELIDQDMDFADMIAYAEAKWRGLQKDE